MRTALEICRLHKEIEDAEDKIRDMENVIAIVRSDIELKRKALDGAIKQARTELSDAQWQRDSRVVFEKIVDAIGQRHPSLAAVLAKARFKDLEADNLVIEPVGGDFQFMLLESNLPVICKACQKVMGRPLGVKLVRNSVPNV